MYILQHILGFEECYLGQDTTTQNNVLSIGGLLEAKSVL